jgi:general secretion pathway protein G
MLLTNIQSTRHLTAHRKATRRAAFTLLEVLIVVAILVILASAASISLFRYLEDAKVGKAKTEMTTIVGAVKKYYSEQGSWPDQGGLVQTIGPMIEGNQQLRDPWGGTYQLSIESEQQADGTANQRPFVTCTPPGKPAFRMPPN